MHAKKSILSLSSLWRHHLVRKEVEKNIIVTFSKVSSTLDQNASKGKYLFFKGWAKEPGSVHPRTA